MRVTRTILASAIFSAAAIYVALYGSAAGAFAVVALALLPLLLPLALLLLPFGGLAVLYFAGLAAAHVIAPVAIAALGYAVLPAKPRFRRLSTRAVATLRDTSASIAIVIGVGYVVIQVAWISFIPDTQHADYRLALAAAAGILAAVTWMMTHESEIPYIDGYQMGISGALITAGITTSALVSTGVHFVRSAIHGEPPFPIVQGGIALGTQTQYGPPEPEVVQPEVVWSPEMSWIIWGIALTIAALACAELRRRAEELADMRATTRPRQRDRGLVHRVPRYRRSDMPRPL